MIARIVFSIVGLANLAVAGMLADYMARSDMLLPAIGLGASLAAVLIAVVAAQTAPLSNDLQPRGD